MTIYIESVYIALIAWVYSVILTEPDMLLNRVYVSLEKYLPGWLFNPLIGCVYCVGGQMALWYGIYFLWSDYNVINHILFISITIFTIEIINRVNGKFN